jgi:diguanylate cyclase (GGDEF)-like protein
MDIEKTVILIVKEAECYFRDVKPEDIPNIEFIHAADAGELIKFVYIYNPHFILFNLANLSEDNYTALARLNSDTDMARFHLLFIRSKEEANAVQKAFESGPNPYYLKLFGIMELNARIMDFLEIKQARSEMSVAFNELKLANQEVKKKNKQLQHAITNVEKLATTDYLTGVYNRRYIIDRIKQEIVRFRRTRRMFSFVICDIDNFKAINDTHGHAYGDLLLMEIAKFLSDSCRELDVLARWGGDEFLFILPETELLGAKIFCERARKAISERKFEYGHNEIKVTMTFGVAEYSELEGANESIKNADDALLQGKSAGRNTVVTSKETAGGKMGKAT